MHVLLRPTVAGSRQVFGFCVCVFQASCCVRFSEYVAAHPQMRQAQPHCAAISYHSLSACEDAAVLLIFLDLRLTSKRRPGLC